MKTEYEIGDEAWIYMSNHRGKTTKSTVVHSFKLYGGKTYYVCEVPTPIDPLLEVRCALSMGDAEGVGIGLSQLARKRLKK